MQISPRSGRGFRANATAGATLAIGAALLATLHCGSAAAQVPEVGVWINHEGKGAVEIKPCGAALCGNIVWLREPTNDEGQPLFDRRNPDEARRNRPICGLPVIGNVKRTSDGWDEGWIYNPEEGAQYDVYLRASGDRLTVTGYKGVKLFSKTFTWTRAPADLQRCDGAKQTKAKPPAAAPVKAATMPGATKAPAKPVAKAAPTPAKATGSPTQAKPPVAQKSPSPAKAVTKDSAKSAATPKPPVPKPVAAKKPAATATGAEPAAAVKKPAVVKKKTAEEAEASSAVE